MRTGNDRHWLAGVATTALIGTLMFFVIIGVFGLQFAIAGLLAFVLVALAIYRAFPVEGGQL